MEGAHLPSLNAGANECAGEKPRCDVVGFFRGFSMNGCFLKMVVPPKHPKMIIFSRKTHDCWVPPF